MNHASQPTSRRKFLQTTGTLAAGSVLAGITIPHVHAAESSTIRLALIGCGGRGSGAVKDAFEASGGPVKLVAMADLFEKRLQGSHRALSQAYADKVDVPAGRQFIGFEAYRKAIDCLRPGDVAMLTGYAGFRPRQLEYAVEKGVNVFMEKSFATDPPAVRRVIQAGEAAEKRNLKIAAGLMCRHSRNRQELIKRIQDGQLGEILLVRAYRMEPSGPLGPCPATEKELLWQIRNFTKFLWVSGGLFAEMDIHQIDELLLAQGRLSGHGPRRRRPRGRQQRLQPEPRLLLDRVDLRRRRQGLRRGALHSQVLQRIRHVRPRYQVCGPILRPGSRRLGADLQGSADRAGQHRVGSARRRPSPRGKPSGTTCWSRSATTGRTTRPSGQR